MTRAAILLATLAVAGDPPPPASPRQVSEVVSTLVAAEPEDLSGLEAVIGPVHRNPADWAEALGPIRRDRFSPLIPRVSIGLAIDIYHQRPQRVRDSRLREYRLDFDLGREVVLATLEKARGPAQRLRERGVEVLRFGRFYVRPRAEEGFSLEWHVVEPAFALPVLTDAEETTLVARVVALIQDGPTRTVLQRHFTGLRQDKGWNCDMASGPTWALRACPADAPRPRKVTLSFRPPLPGDALAQALGVVDPAIVSTDPHMAIFTLIDWSRPFPRSTGRFPVAEGYQVQVSVPSEGLELTTPDDRGRIVWRALKLRVSAIVFAPPPVD